MAKICTIAHYYPFQNLKSRPIRFRPKTLWSFAITVLFNNLYTHVNADSAKLFN